MEIVKPTLGSGHQIRLNQKHGINVFQAGSIEMGVAENWQDRMAEIFKDMNITFLNPRRDDWNSDWVQSIDNKNFRDQVEWELNGLLAADFVPMYFDPNTKSPISLLELGLMAKSEKLIVCCPPSFYRRANVDIVCNRFGILVYDTWEEFIDALRHKFTRAIRNREYEATHNRNQSI